MHKLWKNDLASSSLQCYLTCTVDPISSVARITGAGETPLCVNALCILMTVVQDITLTLIDIYNEVQNTWYTLLLLFKCKWLTGAVKSVSIQVVPYRTAAGKATDGIGTDLFTTPIDSVTLIDVWIYKDDKNHRKIKQMSNRVCWCLTNTSHTSIPRMGTGRKSKRSGMSTVQHIGFWSRTDKIFKKNGTNARAKLSITEWYSTCIVYKHVNQPCQFSA